MADIREDGSEIFHYDIPDFSLSIKKNFIPSWVRNFDISIHWHEEIEITYVVSGSIKHQLNGKRVRLTAGEAIFINSKQLHLIETDSADCELYCLIFHPMMLCASNYIAKKYVTPIIENGNLDYFYLKESDLAHKPILDAIVKICELQKDSEYEMKAMNELYGMWLNLYGILPKALPDERVINEDLHRVQKMLSLIHKHYAECITLEEICMAGDVGKTKGTKMFTQYLNMTPVEYLNNYRLELAARMLTETKESVLNISLDTGFTDSSYFARVFRKRKGISPLEYREKYGEKVK